MDGLWNPMEREAVEARFRGAIRGGAATVVRKLQAVVDRSGLDEVLVVTGTFEPSDRFFTYRVVADAASRIQRRSFTAA